MRFAAVIFLAFLLLSVHAMAGTIEEGMAAYDSAFKAQNGDEAKESFQKALQIWQPLANEGNPKAQFLIGELYISGFGVPRDSAVAMMWLRRSAGQGYVDAEFLLGGLYVHGQGVPKNYEDAYFWLTIADASPDINHRGIAIELAKVKPHLSPEQITAVQKRVSEWKPTPAPAKATAP